MTYLLGLHLLLFTIGCDNELLITKRNKHHEVNVKK